MSLFKKLFYTLLMVVFLSTTALAAGYPIAKAPKGTNLGGVKVNPYGTSPLTAVIDLATKRIKDVTVSVHGKPNGGIPIEYPVGPVSINTHDGVPIFGLYQDYRNKVTVQYTNIDDGKKYTDSYEILTPAITNKYMDSRSLSALPVVKVITVKKGFENRLYLNNSHSVLFQGSDINWANQKLPTAKLFDATPSAGSIPFDKAPMTSIIDTKGEFRWWLDSDALYDGNDIDIGKRGYLMGIRETANGTFTFVQGQYWGEFDLTGKILLRHKLPRGYIDMSHESIETPKGTILVRAAKANYVRPDGFIVHTVRDHILELDRSGRLIDVWDMNKILDPLRDSLLLGLDMGAVCLNVDLSQAGQTAESFEPTDAPYGDVAGVGAGRNWAHINSISYDPKDDSIILSFRHQGVVKVTRDKQVKWILAPKAGWNKKLATKVLTPVDSKGKKLECNDNGECKGGNNFDFVFTQHTAWLSPKGTLTVFDNGDGRHLTQPALPTMKYSRFVEYKIDEKNMTVEQLWEYGKERGYGWYSPVTSNVEYLADKDVMYGFGGSVGLFDAGKPVIGRHNEIDYKTKEVKVEIEVQSSKLGDLHYRGLMIEPKRIFVK